MEKIIQELVNTLTDRWSIFRILWKSQTTSRINKKTKTFKWNWSKI
ncbi:hypothetical protein [Spiroplasma endosymbiont of 'Nebria riversi']|nr:hypothetical protein [Spiroplasma endosymbiont of 'Nebria riversi']